MFMPLSKKNWPKYKVTIDNNMPDLSNDPVVLRKAAEAKAFLDKHPLPSEWFTKPTAKPRRSKKTSKKS